MTHTDAINLLDYHYWARDRMLDAVEVLTPEQYSRDLSNSFPSVRDTIVHTFAGERNWYLRWTGNSPTGFPDAAEFPDLATVRNAWSLQEKSIRLFVDSLASPNELDRVLRYRTFDGQEMESSFSQMLQHVVNHATYHRGQVTTMLRQLARRLQSRRI